jgi:hypothetical protein
MHKRSIRKVFLVVLGVLVLALPGFAGCGSQEAEGAEFVIGYQGDFTGPGSASTRVVYDAFMDYLSVAEEEGLLPGITLRVVAYDNRTDYSRYTAGYMWLRGQGAELLLCPASTDIEMNAGNCARDKVPAVGTTGVESLAEHDWVYFLYETQEAQNAGCLKWIADTWDYEGMGRAPRVGAVGLSGLLVCIASVAGMEEFVADNPEEIEWMGAQFAPLGTSAWALEVKALMDCDYIVAATFGSAAGQFMKEARLRGYDGAFMSSSMAFPGFWGTVRSSVEPSDLYECYHQHTCPWCDECSFATSWQEAIVNYRSGYAETEIQLASYPTGWAWSIWVIDAIRRAAEEVGAENLDGVAIQDALASTDLDMTSEGWGGVWKPTPERHFVTHEVKTYRWNVDNEMWVAVSDEWVSIPPA